MIAGHLAIQERLNRDGLPPVALFLGPKSVGRRRFANELAKALTNDPRDVLRINRLTADLARSLDRFIHTAPAGSRKRVAVVNIQSAPASNLNILLKALEDVPTFVHVILLATSEPMETVLSRMQGVYQFSLLTQADVEKALVLRGFSPTEAKIRAEEAGGQLDVVIDRDARNVLKPLVLVVVRCFREHDHASLEALANRWTDEHTNLLVKLAHEATTKRWRFFDEAEAGGIPGRVWLAILRALKPDVRPRLVIHSQLATVLRSLG